MNKKKLRRLLEPGVRLYFIALALFAACSALFDIAVAAVEGVIIILLYLLYRRTSVRRRREILSYIESTSSHVDNATKDSVLNFPLPMVILKLDTGEILWSNDKFMAITGAREHLFETRISDAVPGFDWRFLLEGKTQCPAEVPVAKRVYSVYGSVVHSSDSARGRSMLGTLYWVDVTESASLRQEFLLSRPVVSLIVLDNYEEFMKHLDDSQKSSLLAAVDEKISGWTAPAEGVLRKFDRDRYLFLFQERHLAKFIEGRFSVLEETRSLTSPNGIAVTLSVGIGRDGATLKENFQYAAMAVDMSLSRGGDQAVIKNRFTFDFYGGQAKELEKRTKVKSRVMANALKQLILESSNVLIMGHTGSDIDSIGASAGVAAIVRSLGRKPFIVTDYQKSAAKTLIDRLAGLPELAGVFIDIQTAMLQANRDSLLVVVDTNRPDIVESADLLTACHRVAVIDHHRRAANYIERAALSFHEPYASSASELVTELSQYLLESGKLTRVEAEALLAGIVLDTKNFTMHTGVRTFEAAAFLRGAGADPVSIRRLFQSDLEAAVVRYEIVRRAQIYHETMAVAALDAPVDRTVAAQAADELLDISGVDASFVMFPSGAQHIISARSLGRINVQVIMEKLGGGGHQTIAGAQVSDADTARVLTRLLSAIDQYFAESGK